LPGRSPKAILSAAMSQETVDVVRRIYDAVARRDAVTPFELYAEHIVWDISNWRRAALDPKQVYRGHEGVREAWRETLAVWGEVDFEVEELIDAGDQVLAVIHEREVGRASGVPVESTHVGGLDAGRRQGHSVAGVRRPPRGRADSRPRGVGDVPGEPERSPPCARAAW
jgi:ketosteroid isomerase-like protein